MSNTNRGKDFEAVVKEGIEKTGTYVLRLYDPQGGYASVANPCDFIAFRNHKMFMIECKSLHGNTFSIYSNDPKKKYGKVSNTQWEGLLEASKKGVVAGVLIWWIDADVTKFVPIQTLQNIRDKGAKSIRYDADLPWQSFIDIEGSKKRVYFDYDFEKFFNFFEKGY